MASPLNPSNPSNPVKKLESCLGHQNSAGEFFSPTWSCTYSVNLFHTNIAHRFWQYLSAQHMADQNALYIIYHIAKFHWFDFCFQKIQNANLQCWVFVVLHLVTEQPRLTTSQPRVKCRFFFWGWRFSVIGGDKRNVVEMSLDVVEIILNKPCLTTFQPRLRCR